MLNLEGSAHQTKHWKKMNACRARVHTGGRESSVTLLEFNSPLPVSQRRTTERRAAACAIAVEVCIMFTGTDFGPSSGAEKIQVFGIYL